MQTSPAVEHTGGRALVRHPDSAGGEGVRIEAEATRAARGGLQLRYSLIGDMAGLRIPPAAEPERANELWRHTCFEAFLRSPDGGYLEFNFAPSLRWAAYRFDGYRSGMRVAQEVAGPALELASRPDRLDLSVTLDLARAGLSDSAWPVSLTTVIEDVDGAVSYWALAHAPGKPDFHRPDSFVLELPPPDPR